MSINSLGQLFRITSFGESHGTATGVVIDGCPSGLKIDLNFIQSKLSKRKPGQSTFTTQRNENDDFEIISGVFENTTLGSPICILIKNNDQKSSDYSHLKDTFRPSHADYTYENKYGNRDYRGGGHSSARITAGWVAAGAIAELLLKSLNNEVKNIKISGWVQQVYKFQIPNLLNDFSEKEVEESPVRCPHPETSANIEQAILDAKFAGDSLGGIIACRIKNCPIGLGEPVFDKLHARLAKAMLTINAVKGFEYGDGFEFADKKGSEVNDQMRIESGESIFESNHSGGIQGGISNGEDIFFKVAFKPTATISVPQKTITKQGQNTDLEATGRHDPCVLPRAVPIVEAMSWLTLADFYLLNKRFT